LQGDDSVLLAGFQIEGIQIVMGRVGLIGGKFRLFTEKGMGKKA
jgi:hypothetical protein